LRDSAKERAKRLERSIELNRFIKRVGWLSTLAILFTTTQVSAETATNSTGGNASTGRSGSFTQGDIDQLLANARQAMAQGDLAKAESLLKQAEAAKPKYPVLHFGDTPARLRRDLEKLVAGRPGDASSKYAPQVTAQSNNQVSNPFTTAQQASAAQQASTRQQPSASDENRNPTQQADITDVPREVSLATTVAPHVATPAATAVGGSREECDIAILSARQALVVGDLARATKQLETAQACHVSYADNEDSPARLAQSLADLRQLEASKDNSASWKYSYAKFLLGQGEVLLARGDLDSAERAASEAAGLMAGIATEDKSPMNLLGRIAQTRKERNAAAPGEPENRMIVDEAVAPAAAAVPVDLTLPNLEQQMEVPRLAQLPNVALEPLPTTENLAPEMMDPFALLQEGEMALRAGNRGEALNLFRMAHARRNELDGDNQQRLQDHLQMLSSGPGAAPARPGAHSLLDDASSGQAVIARQLSADIGKRQTEAAKIRETDPKKSLAILQEAGETVAKSELDESTKTQLMRRLSLSIAETERYIKDHGAELELDEANKNALGDVERERAVKAQVRDKMAEMVDQFNQLRDEQRYAEMEVVAKRLYDMAPDEPVAQQVWENAKFIRRTMLNRELNQMSEEGVVKVFQDIKKTSAEALVSSTDPINYNAETWDQIKNRPAATSQDAYRTEREMEIHRKLKTPVLPSYNDMPLAEVIDGLSKLAGMNIHLDPRGLSQEGVQSDTTVTLNLGREISLESALNLILEPLHLTYMIKDEVLKVTSEQIRDGDLELRVYNVADLVIPIPNFVPSSNMGLQGLINDATSAMRFSNGSTQAGPVAMVPTGAPGVGAMPGNALAQQFGNSPGQSSTPMGGGPGGLGGAANADFDSLIDLITSTVEYDTWMENGSGEGEIQPFPTNLSLVVSQTQNVHEQIVDLLEQLRRLQDLQVTIEVRFIRLSDSFFERIGIDFDFNITDNQPNGVAPNISGNPSSTIGISSGQRSNGTLNPDTSLPNFTADVPYRSDNFSVTVPAGFAPGVGGEFGFAILSDIQAYFLLQAAQSDSRSNILQAPKVTLFNGQQGIVADTALRPFVISVIPVVGEFAAAQQPVIVVLSEGTLLTVQAVVSDDRKYVRLTLVPFFSQIGDVDTFTFEGTETTSTSSNTTDEDEDGNDETDDSAEEVIRSGTTVQLPTFQVITVATTVSVPDGGTVLLGGVKRLSENRSEVGVPLLSKVPYVDRLFRNVGIDRTTDSLMMMVTPHIIIQEEQEERLGLTQE
jgi:general secretion pathway protein D